MSENTGTQNTEQREVPVDSALYWHPRVRQVVPDMCPKTLFVEYEHHAAMESLSRNLTVLEGVSYASLEAACELVGWPAFIRTDHGSAKHWGPVSYKAARCEDFRILIPTLVEDQEMKTWMTDSPRAFMVREWLDLAPEFEAFGAPFASDAPGHGIAREWRVFANAEEAVCAHFYWEEHDSIQDPERGPNPRLPEDWRERLNKMSRIDEATLASLKEVARRVAQALPRAPAWSVDFAQDRNGKWWVIDLAPSALSWHPPGCEAGDARW